MRERPANAGPAQDEARANLKTAVSRAAMKSAQAFKIPEQGAVEYHLTRAWKWAFQPLALVSYAADSVAVAGLAWLSRILAARSEFLEAMKSPPALQGVREARHPPRQLSSGS